MRRVNDDRSPNNNIYADFHIKLDLDIPLLAYVAAHYSFVELLHSPFILTIPIKVL